MVVKTIEVCRLQPDKMETITAAIVKILKKRSNGTPPPI